MNDERLDSLEVAEPANEYGASLRISKIKLINYKFFYGEFELPVDGENLLLYGENGSGKSSIYRALELLTKERIENLGHSRNIFSESGDIEVEFGFTNGTEFTITEDTEVLPDYVDFLKALSVFKPMLDYKKLLKVHYTEKTGIKRINLYGMFRQLLRDFPVSSETVLSGIKDLNAYFTELEKVVDGKLLEDINHLIQDYFDADIRVDSFEYRTEIDDETGGAEPIVNMIIDFKDNRIQEYHTFLNEARLSALAVSIYFAAIKSLFGALENETLKILVLDDLLISLDMSNRLKLLNILKQEFADFQIFFFTHDKELFELYRNKMPWKKYELYLDDSEDIHKPILKIGKSETERAKEYFAKKDYDCCALLLRRGFEKILKSYLTPKEQLDKNCNELDLASLVDRAAAKSSGEHKAILEKLNSDRKHILNPLSHNDNRPVYSEELKQAMVDLEKLKELLKRQPS